MLWLKIIPHVPKNSRYTIGSRIENKFLDLLESSYVAYFANKNEKLDKVSDSIFVLDSLKFLLSIAWEAKIISNKHFEEISLKLDEIGKMFGGWRKSLGNHEKKNRTL